MPRKEAYKLQYRITDLILGRREDASICSIIFGLSEDWIAGKPLPIAERMALVACEAAQQIPEIQDPYSTLPEAFFDLERKYHVYGANIAELATKHGPHEQVAAPAPTHPSL